MLKTDFHFINGGKFISRGSGRHTTRTLDSMELIYVIGGTLDMFEEDVEFHLKTGDFLYLYPFLFFLHLYRQTKNLVLLESFLI